MKILAIDTSSRSAGCALTEDEVLLGECYSNVSLTHSQTIMPMIDHLLAQTRITLSEVDSFAVTNGPGSFTGLRIGLSAVKGMAHALHKSCIAVSTLEALCWNLYPGAQATLTVAPVLDARCQQVYTALARWEKGSLQTLFADQPISLEMLRERLQNLSEPVFLVGDGAEMCYNKLQEQKNLMLAPPALRFTRAASVALAANRIALAGNLLSPQALSPAYLRLPQAERELLAKQNEKK